MNSTPASRKLTWSLDGGLSPAYRDEKFMTSGLSNQSKLGRNCFGVIRKIIVSEITHVDADKD